MNSNQLMRTLIGCAILAATSAAIAGDPGLFLMPVGNTLDLDTGVTTNVGGLSVAYNSVDNEYRATWFDSRISGQNDVYSQRVSYDGKLAGDNIAIIVGSDSSTDTAIAHDPIKNTYLITWKNQSGGPGSAGFNHTYGGMATSDGGLTTTPTDLSNAGLERCLVYNDVVGEFFFTARNFAGGGTSGIYGQRVSDSGKPIGGSQLIASSGAPAPSGGLAFNPNANQYLSTWRDQTAEDLKARIINADGTFATGAFSISTMFPESGLAAGVAFDAGNDRYLVVYSEFCAGLIYGQFVDADGSLVGDQFTIIKDTNRLMPVLCFNDTLGAYMLAWRDSSTGAATVQLLDADGGLLGDSLVLAASNTSSLCITTSTTGGRFIAIWTDRTNSPTRVDVLGQVLTVSSDMIGDMNCDGDVDFGDINPYVLALTNASGYALAFPDCDIMNADINQDGEVNFGDINPFVSLLTNP